MTKDPVEYTAQVLQRRIEEGKIRAEEAAQSGSERGEQIATIKLNLLYELREELLGVETPTDYHQKYYPAPNSNGHVIRSLLAETGKAVPSIFKEHQC